MAPQRPEPGDLFVRGVSSALRLVWREPETLDLFREQITDARSSYAAVALVLPIYFAAVFTLPNLVSDLGRLPPARLDPAVFAALVTSAMLASFVIYPLLVRPFLQAGDERSRLAGYVAAQNIASIPVAVAVCGPLLLFGVHLIDAPIAAAAAIASAVLTIELRFFLAARILGVDRGLAGVLVGIDIGLQAVLVQIAIAATIVLR